MVLAGLEESSVEQRCAIAGHLLDALAAIPTSYIAAISATMVRSWSAGRAPLTIQLHHLASVGHLLASVIQQPLSQWSFLQVRNVILAMSDLIYGLETALAMTPDISAKLKAHAIIIDDRMRAAASAAGQTLISSSPAVPALRPSMDLSSTSAHLGQTAPPIDTGFEGLDDWTFEFSPDHQLQLQNVLTANWPFEFTRRGSLGYDSLNTSAPVAQGGYHHFWSPSARQWSDRNDTFGRDG